MGQGLIVGQPAWLQRKIHLRPQHRGVHLVTEEILRGVGLPHIHIHPHPLYHEADDEDVVGHISLNY